MKRFIIIILLLTAKAALSQNITEQTISWQVLRTIDVNTGEMTTTEDKIISYATSKIEWIDKKGVIKRTFTINEVNGTWTNIQNTGVIIYEVDYQGRGGTVTFQKTETETEIIILLLKDDDIPEMYEMVAIATSL